MPALDVLIETSQNLNAAYEEERLSMDKNRFLSSLRSLTKNPVRLSDITFVANLGGNISNNQENYNILRLAFKDNNPSNDDINNFLRRALTGAFILYLSQINDDYLFEGSVKERSAMAKLTCNLLAIERFSDIPKDEQKACLQSLRNYLNVITNHNHRIKWHPAKTNRSLMQDIVEEQKILGVTSQTQLAAKASM